MKAAVSKIAILCMQYRGFESHPLRHPFKAIFLDLDSASVHFTPEEPLPSSLVKKIVRARVKELSKSL